MPTASLPLKNLRGMLIILILAFHSFSAYLASQPDSPSGFDRPPEDWTALRIIDNERWVGFDLFSAFQFLYLMQLMFFLSGLFVWPSLQRKGWRAFLLHRMFRLGIPFLLGTYLLIPLALYPVYRVTAIDQSWPAFWAHYKALPSTPTGPMWFLWFLMVLDVCAVLLSRLMPTKARSLQPFLSHADVYPGWLFGIVICISTAAYLPLSVVFPPWKWVGFGPFAVQAAFGPQYLMYFLFGVAVGRCGLDRGLLDVNGAIVKQWGYWVIGSFVSFFIWLIPTALIVKVPSAPLTILRFIGDLGLLIFVGAACFAPPTSIPTLSPATAAPAPVFTGDGLDIPDFLRRPLHSMQAAEPHAAQSTDRLAA
jgi:glucans biosynthesis protein C